MSPVPRKDFAAFRSLYRSFRTELAADLLLHSRSDQELVTRYFDATSTIAPFPPDPDFRARVLQNECATTTTAAFLRRIARLEVFGGEEAGSLEHQETVAILFPSPGAPSALSGSGVLISDRVVLTISHVASRPAPNTLVIGGTDLFAKPQTFRKVPNKIVAAPGGQDELSLLIFSEAVGGVPVPLASTAEIDQGLHFRVVGFGLVQPHGSGALGAGIKRTGDIQTVLSKSCTAADANQYFCQIGRHMVAKEDQIGTCGLDSGGPLLVNPGDVANPQWKLAGITDQGGGTAACGSVGLYQRVDTQLQWIKDTLAASGIALP